MKKWFVFLLLIASPAYAQVVINPAPVPACVNGNTLIFNGTTWGCSTAGTGTITGSGTAGVLQKIASGTTVLGDSIVSESGTVLTVAGSMVVSTTVQTTGAKLAGSTSGTITLQAANVAGTNTIKFPAGTVDFSATGGTGQVVRQSSSGGAFTVATVASTDLSDTANLARLNALAVFTNGVNAAATTGFGLGSAAGTGGFYHTNGLTSGQAIVYAGLGGFRVDVEGLSSALTVAKTTGYLTAPGVYNQTSGSAANVFVDSSGNLLRSTSSMRYKDDIKPFTGGLGDLLKLQAVTFVEKKNPTGPRFLGFTAEAVDAAGLTYVVNYDDQGRPDALEYDRIIAYVPNALKELNDRVKSLEARAGIASPTPITAGADMASKQKALASEASKAAKRAADAVKAEVAKVEQRKIDAARESFRQCQADNVIILQQKGKPVDCQQDAASKAIADMDIAKQKADKDAADLAAKNECERKNKLILKQGGTALPCVIR